MKKLFAIMIMLLALMAAWGEGQKEGVTEITLLHAGTPDIANATGYQDDARGGTVIGKAALLLQEKYPGVVVKELKVNLATGSTVSMDALLAAGTPPDVYQDYMGRVSKYLREGWALDLSKYIDTSKYSQDIIKALSRNGKVLAVPLTVNAQGMCINLDIMKRIGYTVPKDWTLDDFLTMAAKVRALNDGTYATGMFAANQSGDYLYMQWLSTFGAQMYKDGDYSRTVFKETGGQKMLALFKLMHTEGYIPKESAVLCDDDYVLQWSIGKLAATAFYESWSKPYFETAVAQGLIKKPFEYKLVAFPKAPGVKTAPVSSQFHGIVVRDTGNEKKNRMLADFAALLSSADSQEIIVRVDQVFATHSGVDVAIDNPHWKEVRDIVAANGLLDLGITSTTFSAVRAEMYPRLQALFMGKETSAEATDKYQANVNVILKGE